MNAATGRGVVAATVLTASVVFGALEGPRLAAGVAFYLFAMGLWALDRWSM